MVVAHQRRRELVRSAPDRRHGLVTPPLTGGVARPPVHGLARPGQRRGDLVGHLGRQQWSGQQQVPGTSANGSPVLIAGHDRLHLYWQSRFGDAAINHSSFDGTSWQRPQLLFGGRAFGAPPEVTNTHTARVWMVLSGPGSDRPVTLVPSPDGVSWNYDDAVLGPEGTGNQVFSLVGRVTFGAGTDRLPACWSGPGYTLHCPTSDDNGNHWSRPAATAAHGMVRPGLAGWGSVDAYAAWTPIHNADHRIYWANTLRGANWYDPATNAPSLPGNA